MLRFLSERRAWVIAAIVALTLVIGSSLWVASRSADYASGLISERLGMVAEVTETQVSIGRIELRGVELRGSHGGFVTRIDAIEANVSLLAALFRGAAAVRRVAARGVDVEMNLADEGLSESIASARAKLARPVSAPGAHGQRASSGGRTYEVSEANVRVFDRHGALISTDDASFQKMGNAIRSRSNTILLGNRNADQARIGPSELMLVRDAGTWTLSRLQIDGASVRAVRDGGANRRALALRLRDFFQRLRPPRGATPTSPADSTTSSVTPPIPPRRLFARLSSDAFIDVSDVRIESLALREEGIERIEDFGVSVRGADDGWYRVEVSGQTSNQGTLDVDLSLQPAEARAEGSVRLRRLSLALLAPFAPELPLHEPELGTVSAQLELIANSRDRVSMQGGFQVRQLALAHDRIAPEPVSDINFDIRGRGAWLPDVRRLEIESARVRMNRARMLIEGELERTPNHYRVDLVAKLPPTDCNDVVGAIPDDVLRSLSRFAWSGNWSAWTRLSLDSRDLESTELSIRVRDLCTFERTPDWVRIERFQEPFLHRVVEPDDTVFEMVTGPETDNWVDFADISPFMVPAVISHEDGAFYEHGGFAPWAIRDALVRNLDEGRYVVGASTISMQLAKNLYLKREKTIARKVQEVILTWWLENALTKDEILELYLNVIEYGPGVYGLLHAAAYYFGRAPAELSPAEAAFLACMLPSPKRYHVSYERGELTRSMRSRMRRLMEHMAKRERIGPEALAYGLAELEGFQFHREGDPPPPPRVLPPLGAPEQADPLALDPFEALFVAP